MAEDSGTTAIGVDLGGTAIKGGLVTPTGKVLAQHSVRTERDGGVDHVIERMVDLIDHLRKEARNLSVKVQAIGLGMPGTLSRRRGTVISPPNLPGWRNVPIVERIGSATGLSVMLDNDANNAALGEYLCGAGWGVRDLAVITLGTGIGGGLILDGKLWRGYFENAGEIGHNIIHAGGRRCSCGQQGCLEAYSSANSIVARTIEGMEGGEESCLRHVHEAGDPIRAEMIVDAAAAGDKLATRIWQEACWYLAIACVNLQHLLNLQRIVLSGGLSGAGERLKGPVEAAMNEVCSTKLGHPPELRIASLGNSAGFIGSALSVFLPG
ncbi:MAG TPA: ROK family protein [Phycisphaerae bacterium]|nr:ROK family protein [Phycisphaerae bacterium]